MNVRHRYLKIETVPSYSPVDPDDAEHRKHRLDCTRNIAHIDATIPQVEVDRRSLDALVFREYLDAAYAVTKNTPFIAMAALRVRRGRVLWILISTRWNSIYSPGYLSLGAWQYHTARVFTCCL